MTPHLNHDLETFFLHDVPDSWTVTTPEEVQYSISFMSFVQSACYKCYTIILKYTLGRDTPVYNMELNDSRKIIENNLNFF